MDHNFGGKQQQQNGASNNQTTKGNDVMSNELTDLLSILQSNNLVSSINSIPELQDMLKNINERIKSLNSNIATQQQKACMPNKVEMMTTDLSPQIPGIVLSSVVAPGIIVIQPVLVYRTGITDVTDTIFLQGENAPRGVAKAATSFMTKELLARVSEKYKWDNGTERTVLINAPFVLNLDPYFATGKSSSEIVELSVSRMYVEWITGIANRLLIAGANAGKSLPDNIFKDNKIFGQHQQAIGRIENICSPEINGLPTPYNLVVRASTTSKHGSPNFNSNNSQSICATYLNVTLESLGVQQFRQLAANPTSALRTPLVPVISIGETIAGETMKNNNSIMSTALGLFLAVGVNKPMFFSEALRSKQIGNRGNIGNFNTYLTEARGPQMYPIEQYITEKNICNAAVVNAWLSANVSTRAVYVIDIPQYTQNVSNLDFIIHLAMDGAGSEYHAAFIAAIDKLTNGKFQEEVRENVAKGASRNAATDWIPGDPVFHQSPIIKPTGYAQSLAQKGQWFNLAEVDDMLLRSPQYWGQNEQAITEYAAMINGASQGDVKVRQFNIYNKLNQLFSGNVYIDGWSTRVFVASALISTMVRAMQKGNNTITMSSANGVGMWDVMSYSNEYLTMLMNANLSGNTLGGLAQIYQ